MENTLSLSMGGAVQLLSTKWFVPGFVPPWVLSRTSKLRQQNIIKLCETHVESHKSDQICLW